MELGYLSAVRRLQRRSLLSGQELLCHAAAKGGHLEELKLLHANGCPWDTETCTEAAEGGHLEVLQWLCANGCPCVWQRCVSAASEEPDVLAWLHENCDDDDISLFDIQIAEW